MPRRSPRPPARKASRQFSFLLVSEVGSERTGVGEEGITLGKQNKDGNSETELYGQGDRLILSEYV